MKFSLRQQVRTTDGWIGWVEVVEEKRVAVRLNTGKLRWYKLADVKDDSPRREVDVYGYDR